MSLKIWFRLVGRATAKNGTTTKMKNALPGFGGLAGDPWRKSQQGAIDTGKEFR
jgi:hypothetical protein